MNWLMRQPLLYQIIPKKQFTDSKKHDTFIVSKN